MSRTRIAALQAAAAAFVLVVGTGLFLGFATVPTVVTGLVLAAGAALLLLAAAARAGTAGTSEGPPGQHDPVGPPRPAPPREAPRRPAPDTDPAAPAEEPDRG